MKKIFLFILVSFFSLFSYFHSYAAVNTDAVWGDIKVSAVYKDTESIIYIAGVVPASVEGSSNYTLGLDINGASYRKTFIYNDDNNNFEVIFTISENILESSYSYNISVKNSQYYEVYKDSRILYFNNGIGTSTSASTQGTVNGTISNSTTAEVAVARVISDMNTKGYSTSQKISYIENLMIALAEYNSSTTWEQTLITEIIAGLALQREIYQGTYNPTTPSTVPLGIYSSKQAEPSKINGIGNNPSYKSWRVSQ